MTFSADPPVGQDPATKVERFITRFGNESYRSLAYCVALPLVLTPELVHYLRIQFLRGENVPWEAEVDLLLSDLCSQVGYELYTLDTQIRAYLLAQMKADPVWQHRMGEVAQVLISYVNYLRRIDPNRRHKEIEAQRLAAMTYLGDEQCQEAVQEIADRLKQLENQAGEAGVSERGIRAELAYLTRIAQEQAPQLQEAPELVELARLVQRLLRNPDAVPPEAVARSFRVGEHDLSPRVFPFGTATQTQEPIIEGFPPLKTLTFDTGKFLGQGATFPPLEPQTVQVAELYFNETAGKTNAAADATATHATIPRTEFVPFTFTVATVERRGDNWRIRKEQRQAQRYLERLGNGMLIRLVMVPGGSFIMGSPSNEPERSTREGPQHSVYINPFLMGRHPITQEQWRVVAALPQESYPLKPDPSQFKGDNRPVERVSWFEAVEFCDRLKTYTGRAYRLPTEAEWEYACRAHTSSPFHFGDTISPELANYRCSASYNNGPTGNELRETTPAGQFRHANGFGLCDMHGNVLEWCEDHYHDSYNGAPTDGSAWVDKNAKENALRVLRGGSWFSFPRVCRSAYRVTFVPRESFNIIGFRVVCQLTP